jgi:hypothetical protein
MGRRKPATKPDFIMFHVHYEDGSQTSYRKVPADLVDSLEGDGPIRAFFEAQDREIAERSGRPRARIKDLERV